MAVVCRNIPASLPWDVGYCGEQRDGRTVRSWPNSSMTARSLSFLSVREVRQTEQDMPNTIRCVKFLVEKYETFSKWNFGTGLG